MEKKMIKITNCRQFECLVELMEKNIEVAKGFIVFGSTKQEYYAAWDVFAKQLNSLGPPTREGAKWLNVWIDFKNKIKKKLGNNKKEISATGGGSNSLYSFSPLEKSVISLLSLEKVSSVANRTFGLEITPQASTSTATSTNCDNNEISVIDLDAANLVTESVSMIVDEELQTTSNIPAKTRSKRSVPSNIQEERRRLLEDQTSQIKQQTEYLKDQTTNMDEQTKYVKECARYFRKSYEIKEQKFKIWKETQLEKRKHRQQNMKYKLRALDYKERKLALKVNRA